MFRSLSSSVSTLLVSQRLSPLLPLPRVALMGVHNRIYGGPRNAKPKNLVIRDVHQLPKGQPPLYFPKGRGGIPRWTDPSYPHSRPGVSGAPLLGLEPHNKKKRKRIIPSGVYIAPWDKANLDIIKVLDEINLKDFIRDDIPPILPKLSHDLIYPRVTENQLAKFTGKVKFSPEKIEIMELKRDQQFFDHCVARGIPVPPVEKITRLRKSGIILQARPATSREQPQETPSHQSREIPSHQS